MDCMKTEKLAENYSDIVYVSNGTVCFICCSSLIASPSFKINNQSFNYTHKMNTTLLLVVYNTTSIFTTTNVTRVQCTDPSTSAITKELKVMLESKFYCSQ